MNERERLIQELVESRQSLHYVLDDLDSHLEIYPDWTVRELLAHLTGWDDAVVASLRAHVAGRVPAAPAVRGVNHYNEQSVAEREALDLEHVRHECELSRQLLITILHEMPDEKFIQPLIMPWGETGTVTELVQVFIHHEKEHAREIRQRYLSHVG
ncbi:MAG: maleylpyruvate isomerase N-terminal domain-containing protein [Anaerolineales bacterium]|nr:maleylpyruvate isomerase N-terminal domain-containing protein [Anaerolineales bacterium]